VLPDAGGLSPVKARIELQLALLSERLPAGPGGPDAGASPGRLDA
jgi:hypothetical protein